MNAYELADRLDMDCKNGFCDWDSQEYAANMLRQQADKLKKYELRNLAQCDRIAILEAQNKQQADRIAELEKQLDIRTKELIGASFYEHDYKTLMADSKPVAWIDPNELDMNVSTTVTKNKQFNTDIPVYTAPQKEKVTENTDLSEKVCNCKEKCEPVAYRWKSNLGYIYDVYDHGGGEPLYATPQTKPLSEPVAWMYGNTVSTNMITGGIPLYTTPQTKPSPDGLTDPKSYYQGYEDGVQSLTVTDPRPVAFMKDCGGFTDDPVLATQDGFNFPMYVTKADYQKIKQKKPYDAPQTKPLSDEEIMYETVKAGLTAFKDTDVVLLEHATGELIDFARAIEAKVRGEK